MIYCSNFKFFRFRDENMSHKNGKNRKDIKAGSEVYIVLKKDQRSGKRTKGPKKRDDNQDKIFREILEEIVKQLAVRK